MGTMKETSQEAQSSQQPDDEQTKEAQTLKQLTDKTDIIKHMMQLKKEQIDIIENSLEEIDILFDATDNKLLIGNCFFTSDVNEMEEILSEEKKEEENNLLKLTNDFKNMTTEREELLRKQYVTKASDQSVSS